MTTNQTCPSWPEAPPGWNWVAQDEDGRWFWYRVQPILGAGGGIWRSPSRAQQFACQGLPNSRWFDTLSERPTQAS